MRRGNIMARTRMVFLYDVSARDGRLIVGINKYADSKVNPLVNATPEAQAIAELLKTEPLLDGDAGSNR